MPRVRGGAGGGVSVNAYTGTERRWPGVIRGNFSPPTHSLGWLKTISFPSWRSSHASGYQWWDVRGGSTIRTNLRVHFAHHHVQYDIVILKEGNAPYP